MSFWDNRSCKAHTFSICVLFVSLTPKHLAISGMHRAVVDFSPHKRVMRRVTIQGDVPYFDPHADKRVAAEAEQLSKL